MPQAFPRRGDAFQPHAGKSGSPCCKDRGQGSDQRGNRFFLPLYFSRGEAAGHARTVCGNFSCIEGARGNGRLSAAAIAELYGAEVPVVRIMPNTPVSVGAGMVLYATNSSATKEETETLVSALELAGKTHEISEAEMDAASIISGCAPAYVFMFIKALADAGTSLGLDEKSSLLYAEQTVFGSAKLAMESGKAPDELKKEVCSPGGTTIEGVKSLEKDGLAEIVHSAAEASYRRTLELAGKACGAK